jgi:hypothetical protein
VGGDDQAEHRVAEELEPLVRLVTRVLRAPRPVRDGEREEVRVGERATEPFGEAEELVGVQGIQPRRATT